MNAHMFRVDGVTHLVLTGRSSLKRGRDRALCGTLFDGDAQRLTPNSDDPQLSPRVTCDHDRDGLVAFTDLLGDV